MRALPLLLLALAAAPDDAWIAGAVTEALDWEVMPGTDGGEPDPARAVALRTFFKAHPEYRDPARRAALAREACGLEGTEAAHKYLTSPPPRAPVVVEVAAQDWKLFLVHRDQHCTSDDFAWYASEAAEAARTHGAAVEWAGPTNDALVVRAQGREVARIPLSGTGYLLARSGRTPRGTDYGPQELEATFAAYYGPAGKETGAGVPATAAWSLSEAALFGPSADPDARARLLKHLGAPADGAGVPVTEAELRALLGTMDAALTYQVELEAEARPPVAAAAAPAKSSSPPLVSIFLRPENLALARAFRMQHAPALARAAQRHGVREEDLVAILLWQSKLGAATGKYRLVNLLLAESLLLPRAYAAQLAAGAADPGSVHGRRVAASAAAASLKLATHLRFCKAKQLDPVAFLAARSGGVGPAQLTPDAYRFFVDGDGDGHLQLDGFADSIASLANLLEANGYRADRKKGLAGYNAGKTWVAGVMQVADTLARAP